MSEQKKQLEEVTLDIKDATVTTFNNVNYYQWNDKISGLSFKWWTMGPLSGQAIGGGIHVHGAHEVFMTDLFPPDNTKWFVGSYNSTLSEVSVSVYAISLT
jgi:hypothetical protein